MRHPSSAASIALVLALGLWHTAQAGEKYVLGAWGSTQYTGSAQSDTDLQLQNLGMGNLQSSMSNSSGAYKLVLGYEFSPYLAVEGGYFNLGTLGYAASFTNGGTPESVQLDNKITGYSIAVLGMAPLNDKFTAFGKLGFNMGAVEGTGRVSAGEVRSLSDNNNIGYGLGLTYQMTDKWGLRTEWETIATDVKLLSIGLRIKY